MLNTEQFLLSSTEAYRHANDFLRVSRIGTDEFLNEPDVAIRRIETYLSYYHNGMESFNARLAAGYASWLMVDAHGMMGIAISTDTMVSWHQQTGKPIKQQHILSLLHELAHTIVTPRLLAGPAIRATPEEEERAWVFAYVFLATICGDYSWQIRKTADIDDVAKFII